MDIKEISHVSGSPITSTLQVSGIVNNVDIGSGGILPGCGSGSSIRHSVCSKSVIPPYFGNSQDDWVYYDFPTKCYEPVNY